MKHYKFKTTATSGGHLTPVHAMCRTGISRNGRTVTYDISCPAHVTQEMALRALERTAVIGVYRLRYEDLRPGVIIKAGTP